MIYARLDIMRAWTGADEPPPTKLVIGDIATCASVLLLRPLEPWRAA